MSRVLLKLAAGLAFRRSPGNRWRQVSVPFGALILTLTCLFSAAFVQVSADSDANRSARMPVLTAQEQGALSMVIRAEKWGNRQFPFVWVDSRSTAAPVPPGLTKLPSPGSAVVSPGALHSGLVRHLGLRLDPVGSGDQGTIGPEGLSNASELLIYARPPEGRSLGHGGAIVQVDRFGPVPGEATQNFETDGAQPSRSTALYGVLLFLVAPALLLAIATVLATSELRALRGLQLARLGVRRSQVVMLSGMESGLLAFPGVVAGGVAWFFAAPRVTALPLSGISVFPGDLSLSHVVTVGTMIGCLCTVALIGARPWASPSSLSQTSDRSTLSPPTTWLALLPLGVAIGLLVGAKYLGGAWSAYLLVFGLVPLALALLIATVHLVSVVGDRISRRAGPASWLAGLRLHGNARSLGRPGAVLVVLTFVAGVCTAWVIGFGQPSDPSVGANLNAVLLGWRDGQAGDLKIVQEALPPGSAVGMLHDAKRQKVYFSSCQRLEAALSTPGVCTRSGDLKANHARDLQRLFTMPVKIAPRMPPIPRGLPVDTLMVSPSPLSEVNIWSELNSVLPGVNLAALGGERLAPILMQRWLLSAGVVATALLLLACLQSFANQALHQKPLDARLLRLGLDDVALRRYRTWLYLVPLVTAIPIATGTAALWAWAGEALEVASLSLLLLFFEGLLVATLCCAWVYVQVRLTGFARVD